MGVSFVVEGGSKGMLAHLVVEVDVGLEAWSVGFVVFVFGDAIFRGGGVVRGLHVLGRFVLIRLQAVRGSSGGGCVFRLGLQVLVICLGRGVLVAPGVLVILVRQVVVVILVLQVEGGSLGSQCVILVFYLRRGQRLDLDTVGDI